MPQKRPLSLIHKPHCAGVDEAGRGPLAGPVVAAAVILKSVPAGLNDSKKLTESARDRLVPLIHQHSRCWSIGIADRSEIDQLNILNATFLAMQRAVARLIDRPRALFVDGNRLPQFVYEEQNLAAQAIVGGDARYASIAAASILAKVHRDAVMVDLDKRYPDYGFARHKGYPTKAHRQRLASHGPCPEHRQSFAPVKRALAMAMSI